MQIDSIKVEESSVGHKQHVHVDWHNEGYHEQRHGPEKLIHPFIGDHSKRRGVEENVVMLVLKKRA